jgi:hypothetical protein
VGRDKQNLAIAGYGDATESLELLIQGADVDTVTGHVQDIEELLDAARQSSRTWRDVRVYLQIQHDGDGSDTWRSEILAGTLELGEALDNLPRYRVEAVLSLTRRPFFEGARTALQLSTEADGTASTSERTLHITDDATAGERNYIDIAAAQVTGNLPAPIELQIRNAEAGAVWWTAYHLTNHVHMTPASLDPIYLGSAASPIGASNTESGDTEGASHYWTLTDTQASYFAGQYVRMLAILTGATAGTYLRAAVAYVAGVAVPIYRAGQPVYADGAGTYDLGVIPVPPGGASEDWTNVSVAILAQRTGGYTVAVDHVQLFAAGAGLYRKIVQGSFSVANTSAMVEDGPEGLTYLRTVSTGARYPLLRGFHEPLHIWPGKDNRLRIWIEGATKGDQVEAQAWYRPRRLSV